MNGAKLQKAKEDTNYNLFLCLNNGVYESVSYPKSYPPVFIKTPGTVISTREFQLHIVTSSEGKYKRSKCKDEKGIEFDSMLELVTYKEFEELESLGIISELDRQQAYTFLAAKMNRSYHPDAIFIANQNFKVKGTLKSHVFKQGERYYVDVKSNGTVKDATFSYKVGLMKFCHGIDIIVVKRQWRKPVAK